MTFEEMRAMMRGKVVPENVVPQNIVEYLMDDEAALPELDTFTFLSRLRALGIGSVDFQYLLEGCGAPKSCVEKIRNNPAMNLQSLILTLEGAGLNSQDYTVMLYTARQIWEKTLTIRLEKSEAAAAIEEAAREASEKTGIQRRKPEPSEKPAETAKQIPAYGIKTPAPAAEEKAEEVFDDNGDNDDNEVIENNVDNNYDDETESLPAEREDNSEPSLTAILEQVRLLKNAEKPAEPQKAQSEPEEYEEEPVSEEYPENYPEETETQAPFEINYEDIPEEPENVYYEAPAEPEFETAEAEFDEELDYEYEPGAPAEKSGLTSEFSQIFDAIKEKKDAEAEENDQSEEFTVTTILAGSKKRGEDDIPREFFEDNFGEEHIEEDSAESADTTRIIAIDRETIAKSIENLEENAENNEETDEIEKEEKPERPAKNYYKGALIAAAIGVLIVAAAGIYFGKFASKNHGIDFAKENNDVFQSVARSYYKHSGVFGGENFSGYNASGEIFGDLLINQEGFCTVSHGKNVYTVFADGISAEVFDGEKLGSKYVISPPENTSIVSVFEENGALAAVFDGKECGILKVQNGMLTYTVRQDGSLCGFSLEDGKLKLASVYIPEYTETFTANDVNAYMPKLGQNKKEPLSAEEIIVTKTDGCAFAVCGEYSFENGEKLRAAAALGDPVAAGTNFTAAMANEENGLLISFDEGISSTVCGKLTSAALANGFAAVCEDGSVVLKDAAFKTQSTLPALSKPAENLRIDGENLLIGDKNGFFAALDCSDISHPQSLSLTKATGVVYGDRAAVVGQNGGFEITLLKREGKKALELVKYKKVIPDERISTLGFGGAANVVFSGDSCGAAYGYFDGFSLISEYTVFSPTQTESRVKTLVDDRTGFTRAFLIDGKIYAESAEGVVNVSD